MRFPSRFFWSLPLLTVTFAVEFFPLKGWSAETSSPTQSSAPAQAPQLDEAKLKQFDRLVQAMDLIQKHYFDETKISDEALINGAIQGMLKSLDPHSEFLTKEQILPDAPSLDPFSPEIGLSLALAEKYMEIVSVQDLSPASKAKVKPKDLLLKIDEILTEKLGISEALKLLRGETGTEVKLTIMSMPDKQVREVTLKREPTPLESSVQSFLISPKVSENFKIAYLRLSLFNEGSGALFLKHLQELDKLGAQALILDLRNNPGGFITEALKVCDAFLSAGAKIVSIEGRLQVHSAPPFITPNPPEQKIWEYPVTVLIDHASSSSAELVAGALKDSKRAVVIGTKSFGKGSVQSLVPLPDGGALKLTTGRYFTPDHRTIHGVGIEPNIVVVNSPQVEQQLVEWRSKAPSPPSETLLEIQDRPFQRAAELLKGLLYMQNSGSSSPSSNPEKKP